MNFILPILAAVLQAASFTVDKTVLSFRRVTYKIYTGISFPLLIVIDLAIFALLRPGISSAVLRNSNLLFLLLSIAISIGSNLIFYRALKDEALGEIETWGLLGSFPAIIFSSLVFASERRPIVVAAAITACGAALWSHWRKGGFRVARKTAYYVFWVLAIAPFGTLLSKELLVVWNPVALELVRDAGVAVVFGPLFWRESAKVTGRAFFFLLLTNLLTAAAFILQGFSIQASGVVFTTMVFALLPLLTYFSAVFLLKERFDRRKIIAFAVILAAVAAVKLVG